MAGEGVERKPLSLLTEVASEDARQQWGDLLSRVGFGGERILITRHGKPIAGIVSADDVKRLEVEAA